MKDIITQTMKSLAMMMLFFTRIPIRHHYEFDDQDYQLGIILFPLIGLLIGLGLLILKNVTFFVNPKVSPVMPPIFLIMNFVINPDIMNVATTATISL